MPWHCPACNTIINHGLLETRPTIGERYRCHVCRLELHFNGDTGKLKIAPLEVDHHVESTALHPRSFPPQLIVSPKK